MDKQVPLLARWASPQSHSVPGIHAAGLPDERVSYRRRRNQVDLQNRANSLLQLETQPSPLTDKCRRQKGRRTSETGRASPVATRQRQHPTQPCSEQQENLHQEHMKHYWKTGTAHARSWKVETQITKVRPSVRSIISFGSISAWSPISPSILHTYITLSCMAYPVTDWTGGSKENLKRQFWPTLWSLSPILHR